MLKSPGVARLLVTTPIGFNDRRRAHQSVRIEVLHRLRPFPAHDQLPHPFGVDARIDDEMRHMDALWTKLARHRLRDRAEPELGAGKGCKSRAAPQTGRSAGEEDIALAARQHQTRRFPPGKEAGIAGHFPDLSEYALGRLDDRKVDVGADVEDADLERSVLVGVGEKFDDLLFLSRIESASEHRAARLLDFLHQRRELFALTPADEYVKSLGGELLGDFAADEVPCADDGDCRVSLFQRYSPE